MNLDGFDVAEDPFADPLLLQGLEHTVGAEAMSVFSLVRLDLEEDDAFDISAAHRARGLLGFHGPERIAPARLAKLARKSKWLQEL